jgi:dynein heavy chain
LTLALECESKAAFHHFNIGQKLAILHDRLQNDISRLKNILKEGLSMDLRYTTRGLFEKDRLIFTAQMTFQILMASGDIHNTELDFLLRGPRAIGATSPIDWLSSSSWAMVKSIWNLEVFRSLASDIEGSSKRWNKYCENEQPENEKLPEVN